MKSLDVSNFSFSMTMPHAEGKKLAISQVYIMLLCLTAMLFRVCKRFVTFLIV